MRFIVPLIVGLGLGACSLAPPWAITDWAAVGITDKTLEDHAVSAYSGKNCSTVRTNQGRTYCEEDEKNPQAQVHCYPTLGKVTCYKKADPYKDNQQRVGENDHNLDRPGQ